MMLKVLVLISFAIAFGCCDEFEKNIIFQISTNNNVTDKPTFVDDKLGSICDLSGKFAFIVHGWQGGYSKLIKKIASKLLQYRGGCIILVDYKYYSNIPNVPPLDTYFPMIANFSKISNVLTKKLKNLEAEGFNPDNVFMYGHSLGARLVIDAAANFGKKRIKEIDVCDPAGPGFDYYNYQVPKNPQDAAKNIQCIHTSSNFGTTVYNCHQDWRMGVCGAYQVGAHDRSFYYCLLYKICSTPEALGSHGLCNQFYLNAFEVDFVSDNCYNCPSNRAATNLPAKYKMGYMETRKSNKNVTDKPTYVDDKLGNVCDVNGKFAFIVHGWNGGYGTWFKPLINKLLQYRGGCIILVDYKYYSNIPNVSLTETYFPLIANFSKVSNVLTKKLKNLEVEGLNPDNVFMYGHSLGARLVIDAAVNFGKKRIKEIDVCDSAGPGFDYYNYEVPKNPQDAAKNVQCIHTTSNFGTAVYNCHQDWRMGVCGAYQIGGLDWSYLYCELYNICSTPRAIGSHGLCNDFYINAFEVDFVSDNCYNCPSYRTATNLPVKFKMGYMETRKS
ncbi:unnamed protein product [Diamesa serratosioi]